MLLAVTGTPALYSVPNSPATTGFMLSMCIQYESAVQTFAQSGYVYPGYSAFSLIADVPSTWDESILVSGYPDEEIVRARRSGENWYLAAMTNDATTMDVPLEFLEEGYNYYAYLSEDNEDGTDIEVRTTIVTLKDSP